MRIYTDPRTGETVKVLDDCRQSMTGYRREGDGVPSQPNRRQYKTQRGYDAAVRRAVSCDLCGREEHCDIDVD